MKLSIKPLVVSTLVLSALSAPVMAELTANVGVTSNYLWRGISASSDAAAVYGGLDLSADSGLYAGLWQSSTDAAYKAETDVYVGFAKEFGGVSVDVGAIAVMYLQDEKSENTDLNGDGVIEDLDVNELYLSVGYGPVSAYVANDSDNKATYFTLSGEFASFGLTYGSYSFDDSASDYTHIDLSYSATDELSFGLSKNDIEGDDSPRLFVSYTKEFEVK